MWKNTDPRHEVYKYKQLVILRPNLKGRWESGMGSAETKHTYSLLTSFEDYRSFSVDDKWNPDWLWTFAPEK